MQNIGEHVGVLARSLCVWALFSICNNYISLFIAFHGVLLIGTAGMSRVCATLTCPSVCASVTSGRCYDAIRYEMLC